jgi:hypothetical protein
MISAPAVPSPVRHAGSAGSAGAAPPRLLLKYPRAAASWGWFWDVSTTMIYTHVLEVAGGAVRSPLNALLPA